MFSLRNVSSCTAEQLLTLWELSLLLSIFVPPSRSLRPLSSETLDRPIRNVRRTESIQSMSAAGPHSECVVRLYIKGLIQWNDGQCRTAISQLLGGPRDALFYSEAQRETHYYAPGYYLS